MSQLLLEKKRFKLKREIKIAKQRLMHNFENIDSKILIPNTSEIVPEAIHMIAQNPSHTVQYAEDIIKAFFPKNRALLSVLKIIQLGLQFTQTNKKLTE